MDLSVEEWKIKTHKVFDRLLKQLNGPYNIFDCCFFENDVFISLRSLEKINLHNIGLDSINARFLDNNILHIKMFENAKNWTLEFKEYIGI